MTDPLSLLATAPTVLRGAVADWPAAKWTFASLAERVGDAVVPVHTGRWRPAGWRVVRDGRTVRRRAADFLRDLDAGRADGYLAGLELFREVPSLRADLAFPAAGLISADVIWIGPAGTATPIHFDLAPNFHAQLRGSKRWRLWRPERKLGPRFAGIGGFAMSRLDAGRGAEAAGEPDFDWQLDAGDLLVLPSNWWHRVDTLTDAISVNRWWRFEALGRLVRLKAQWRSGSPPKHIKR